MRSPSTAPATGLASILPDQPAGSLALAAAVAASAAAPATEIAADSNRLATFDDYAGMVFAPAGAVGDLDFLRPALEAVYSPLAIAVSLLAKTSDEMATFVAGLDSHGEGDRHIDATFKHLKEGKAWLARGVEMIDFAETRLLAGICRAYKAEGVTIEDDALPAPNKPAPAAHPDATLLDLGRRWCAVRRRWHKFDAQADALSFDEYRVASAPIFAEENAINVAAAALPAATFAGLAVKARLLACAADCEADDDAGIMAWAFDISGATAHLDAATGSLVADILRLAAEASR